MGLKFRWPIHNTRSKALNSSNYGFSSFLSGNRTPTWIDIQQKSALATIFTNNPVAYATITLKANMMANGMVGVKDLKTGEIFTKKNINEAKNQQLVRKALNLFDSPNVLQSRKEFITISSIMKDVFGDQFTYGNSGGVVDIRNVAALWNIYPQYMSVLLSGNYFNATEISDIIKQWKWGGYGTDTIKFEPDEILHRKDINIQIKTNDDLVFGTSKLVPLKMPLSNIEKAYESENVVLQDRGARLLISLARKADEVSGVEPADTGDKEEVQKDFEEYGLLRGQKQAFITRQPMDVTTIDQDIRKLGIFETIANDSMSVNNAYGIAHDLVKLWISGSTFENQKEAEKRTYQSTIIPEFNDWVGDIDNWLQMEKYGLQYIPSFEHVAVLQVDKKEAATANSVISKYHEALFSKGAIVYNVWLKAVNLPTDDTYGNKRIFELSPEELQTIGINITTQDNGNN